MKRNYNSRFGHQAIILGLGKENKQPDVPLAVNNETTAWEIYNDRALTIDRELIKDWNDSLNTLLIVAALYSAVLTAFIIESMKLLQEDFTETTKDVLLVMTRQLANSTLPAFDPSSFVAPIWAIRVNYYFFTALSSTLVAALAAVLALQWVGSYDTALNQSSPEERALQRHFRHQGVERWHMDQIIAFLPALIFIALFLFFIGLAEWMWTIHKGIAGIIMAGVIFGATFFLVTTILSTIYIGAPFRTPASRSLPALAVGLYSSLVSVLSGVKLRDIGAATRRFGRYTSRTMINMARQSKQYATSFPTVVTTTNFLRSPRPLKSFDSREKEMVHSVADLKPRALIWLANSVDVLPHTANSFQAIIRETLLLPAGQLSNPDIQNAPWEPICRLLLAPYQHRPWDRDLSDAESQVLEQIWQASTLLGVASEDYYYGVYDHPGQYEHLTLSLKILAQIGLSVRYSEQNSIFRQVCTVIAGVGVLPTNFIAAHLSILHQRQREGLSPGDLELDVDFNDGRGAIKSFSGVMSLNLAATTPPAAFPDEIMVILLDMLALRFQQAPAPGDVALERYMHAAEFFFQEGQNDHGVHEAVITQVLGIMLRHLQKPQLMDPLLTFQHILRLLRVKPVIRNKSAIIAGIFQIFEHFKYHLWAEDNQLVTAQLYTLILPSSYYFNGEDWPEWRVRFYTGLSELLQAEGWSSATLKELIWTQVTMELSNHEPKPKLSDPHIRRLLAIPNAILWLFASIGTGSRWIYSSTVPRALLAQGGENQSHLETWCTYKGREMHWSASELTFTRSILLSNRRHLYHGIWFRLADIQSIDGRAMSSSDWFSLLSGPVLGAILQRESDLLVPSGTILQTLLRVCEYAWFFPEFSAAGGLDWLFRAVQKQEAIVLICLSLDSAKGEEETVGWIRYLYSFLTCQNSIGVVDCPEMFLGAIAAVYSAQNSHRMGDSNPSHIVGRPPVIVQPDTRHIYVRNWSNDAWKLWVALMEEIPDAIRRGYERLEPLESGSRLLRDPDRGCIRR